MKNLVLVAASDNLETLIAAIRKAASEVKDQGGIPVVLWCTDKTQKGVIQKLAETMQTPPWQFVADYDVAKLVWIVVELPKYAVCHDMLKQFNSSTVMASFDAGVGAVAIQFASGLADTQWSMVNTWLNSMSTTLSFVENGASSMRDMANGFSLWVRSLK